MQSEMYRTWASSVIDRSKLMTHNIQTKTSSSSEETIITAETMSILDLSDNVRSNKCRFAKRIDTHWNLLKTTYGQQGLLYTNPVKADHFQLTPTQNYRGHLPAALTWRNTRGAGHRYEFKFPIGPQPCVLCRHVWHVWLIHSCGDREICNVIFIRTQLINPDW